MMYKSSGGGKGVEMARVVCVDLLGKGCSR